MSSFAAMFTMPKPRPILALTGVRAFIAWWVVLFHAKSHLLSLLPEVSTWLAPIIGSGHMRVDLFFILSGFLLSYRYAFEMQTTAQAGGKNYRNFVLKRWWRIYPLHIITVLLLLLLAGVAHWSGSDPGILRGSDTFDLFTNVLLVQAWILPMEFSWNYPAWSLSSEWLAYLTFPILSVALWRVKGPRSALLAAIVLLIVMAVSCHWMVYADVWGYDFMVRLVTEFTAGCLLFHVFRSGILQHWRWDLLTPILFVTALLAGFSMELLGVAGYWLVPLFGFFLFGLAFERGIAARLFERPWFQYWGRRSYSLYITHALTIFVLVSVLPVQDFSDSALPLRLAIFAVYILSMAVVGGLCYRFVEDPLRKLDIINMLTKLRRSS